MSTAEHEQPAPVANDNPPTWELVIADIESGHLRAPQVIADARARDAIGRARYGTPLQAGNGRDSLRDAYEESMDLVVYLKNHMLDPETAPALRKFQRLYGRAISLCCDLRAELYVRDGD